MCGAPVFPAIPTRFVYRPQAAAADVTDDVGSLPPPSTPSTPSGCWDSSLEASALPRDTMAESVATYAAAALLSPQQQPMMAEATRGLLAAARQMAARRPDRQEAPVKAATGGAPVVPPSIEMTRFVPDTMMMPAAADVMDAGSSAPSTPSHSRCSSSLDTTPSPRGPLPPSLPHSPCASQHLTPGAGAAWGLAAKKPPMAPSLLDSAASPCASQRPLTPTPGAAWGLATKPPPLPFTAPAPAPRVVVRQVWAHNFEQETKLIESLLPKFRYAAVGTEFPGTVYRPAGPSYTLKPDERYKVLRSTVDALDPIQLGLTLFDAPGGRLPSLVPGDGATATGATRYVWEFNFREFDVRHHRHALESVAALRARGVDLDQTRRHGVDAAAFGPRLRKWVRARAGLGRAGVVTASGGYDLAYLVKLMLGPGFRMPASAVEFEAVAAALLRRRKVFDVREMAKLCPGDDLRRGLDSVAERLNVARAAASDAHQQAGYDSLVTCYTFVKLREICFDDDGKLASVHGILAEITAF